MNSGFKTSPQKKIGISIFASGTGTNAENIIRYFKNHQVVYVSSIVTNNPDAGVCKIADRYNIPLKIFLKQRGETAENILEFLTKTSSKYIILAGYLKLLNPLLVEAFRHRILNIHPALLPKFGGKGMYGKNVHEKVLANKEKETGITIHEVNENYDEGSVIFQKSIPVLQDDTTESIEEKVRSLELTYFPRVIEKYISEKETDL